jgi:hypothetical protein
MERKSRRAPDMDEDEMKGFDADAECRFLPGGTVGLTAGGAHRRPPAGTPGASAIPSEHLRSASARARLEPQCSWALRWVLAMMAVPPDADEA